MQSQQNLNDFQVYTCTFQLHIQQASMTIKFPCTYTVEVKSMNNKITMGTTRNNVSAVNSIATFNQSLKFETQLLYNPKRKEHIKKQVLLQLNLISTRRPDQQKLVGRVTIDLAEAINLSSYSQLKPYKLQYCSVNASITFSIKYVGKKISLTSPDNFDRDSFSDYQSFVTGIHNKQNPSKQRSFQDSQKTVQMQWKNKTNEGYERNKIIEESYNEDAESRVNTGRNSHKMIGNIQPQHVKQIPSQTSSQLYNLPRLKLGEDTHHNYSSKNLNEKSPMILGNQGQGYPQQSSQRSKTELSDRQYSRKEANQYEQILRNSHAQQKRIWDEEKRLLNDQIMRQKNENVKFKQRSENLQKKLYETELKLCNMEGKIQNSKREMVILQREKQLQIKELKSRVDRITKQKIQKSQILEQKQGQMKQIRQKLRTEEYEKRRVEQNESKLNDQIGKLKRDKREIQEQLDKSRIKNGEISNQIDRLKNNYHDIERLKQQIQKTYEKRQQKLNKQIQFIQNKAKQMEKQIQSKTKLQEDLKIYQQKIEKINQMNKNKEIENNELVKKIKEIEQQKQQLAFRINNLTLQLQQKEQKIKSIQSSFEQKIRQNQVNDEQKFNQVLKQNQQQIDGLVSKVCQLQLAKSEVEQKIRWLEQQVQRKGQQLLVKDKQLKQMDEGNRQYNASLEKQILESYEQLNKKQKQVVDMIKEIEKLKQQIDFLKNYEKGLEEQLLCTNQQKMSAEKGIIDLNDTIKERNLQIQRLLTQKNELKSYQIGLESQLLKYNDQLQSNEQVQKLEEAINKYKEQSKNKQEQLQKYKQDNLESKSYTLGLQEQLLKMHEQIQRLQQRKSVSQSRLSRNGPTQQTQAERRLKQKVKEMEQTILQQSQYQRQLQHKIQSFQHLEQRQQQLQQKIQYTQNLELRQQQLLQKIDQLQLTVAHQKQYLTGLEQKILEDHETLKVEDVLKQSIIKLEKTIKHHQEYQQGLEQKILEDHQNKKQHELKKSLQILQDKLKHSVDYQIGLEQKILSDHEILDHLDKKLGINLDSHIPLWEMQKRQLEDKISRLQLNLSPNSKQIVDLQKKLSFSQEYVAQLEFNAKAMQRKIYQLQQQLSQINNKEDQNNGMFPATIRVIEAKSASQIDEQQQKYQQGYQNNDKVTLISEVPILKNKTTNEWLQDSQSYKDSGSGRKMIDDDMQSPIKQMEMYIPDPQQQIKIRHYKQQLAEAQREIQGLKIELQNKGKQKKVEPISTLLINKTKQIQNYKREKIQIQQKLGQVEEQNKKLKQKNRQSSQLQGAVNGYQQKMKEQKQKYWKLAEAAKIIESQCNSMMQELKNKYNECQKQREQISELKQMHKLMQSPSGQSSIRQMEQITNLIQDNETKQKQITTLKNKLSNHSDTSAKYEDLLVRISDLQSSEQEKEKVIGENGSRIRKLENQLKQVNDQLLNNKRLIAKFRENRENNKSGMSNAQTSLLSEENKRLSKRVEQLEQQLFTYQSNENQKDIEIQALKDEVGILQQQLQKKRNVDHDPQVENNVKKQLSELNSKLEQKSKQVSRVITEKDQKIKNYEGEISKMQNLMKAQRIQYYNKRRQLTQQRDQSIKRQQQLRQQLQMTGNQLNNITNHLASLQQKYNSSEKQVQSLRQELMRQKQKDKETKRQRLQAAMEKQKQAQYIQDIENKIVKHLVKIKEKDDQIEKLKNQIKHSHLKGVEQSSNDEVLKQMQNQMNFLSENLTVMTRRAQQLEINLNGEQQKLQAANNRIQQLIFQLEISHKQQEYAELHRKSQLPQKNENSEQLVKKNSELEQQLQFLKQSKEFDHRVTSQKIQQLQLKLKKALSQKDKAKEQLEQKQMEHMNTQLDLQFKLRQKNQRSQVMIYSANDNQMKKSFNASQDVIVNDIVPASKILKELLGSRVNRSLVQKQIQVMTGRITQLEEQIYGPSSTAKQKGLILQKTRLMSMQFSKLKVSIMKSKLVSQQKITFLSSFRPVENTIKDILKLSQIYSQNLLAYQQVSQQESRG